MHSLGSAEHTFMEHKKVEDISHDNSVAKSINSEIILIHCVLVRAGLA